MSALRFSFVLHIHQPVGNFDFVFSEHTWDVYRPFLDFLEDRSLWPIGLHASGPLLEWMGEHDGALHDRFGTLVADGKVELLSAGWYEPVLAALSPRDRATQLAWMRDELQRRFGVLPRGAWLTERVWTSELVGPHLDAGLEYVLVDDHLLRRAGATDQDLLGPCRATYDGRSLSVFPIDEELRYLIPFKPAEEVASAFRRRHEAGNPLAFFGDDGEKFGGWPRTKEWLYAGGWLKAFGDQMDRLREQGVVRLVTPSQALDELDPGPQFELPPGSYAEMDGWAQGEWTNFLERYREAGRLHEWMTALSEECSKRGDEEHVRRAIGRAQCNDPYWHGVFGGLYMKHLREGVRGQMATAERALRADEALAWEPVKDRRGTPQHWVHSSAISARVTAEAGGTLTELVWLEPHCDVSDVLTRRNEPYQHEAVARSAPTTRSVHTGESASIHEIEEQAFLDALPPTDPEVRTLFRDRVLSEELALEDYEAGVFDPLWQSGLTQLSPPHTSAEHPQRNHLSGHPHENDLAEHPRRNQPAERPQGNDPAVVLEWQFSSSTEGADFMSKRIRVSDTAVSILWEWDANAFAPGTVFAPELSIGCPIRLVYDPIPSEVWQYAIITVSKCPDGFEKIEQGTSITPRWPVTLGRARLTLRPPSPPSTP